MCLQKLPTAACDGLLRPEEVVGRLVIRADPNLNNS